jgi:hypothetical protein
VAEFWFIWSDKLGLPEYPTVYITLGLTMALQLLELPQFPGRIAATEMVSLVPEGVFFLDFTRPLETHRWFGLRNHWIGPAIAIFFPVVHEGEREGGYVVGVDRSSPYFEQLRSMWRQRYPSKGVAPSQAADPLKIVADFASQFPSQV